MEKHDYLGKVHSPKRLFYCILYEERDSVIQPQNTANGHWNTIVRTYLLQTF